MTLPSFAIVPAEQVQDAHRIETSGEGLDQPVPMYSVAERTQYTPQMKPVLMRPLHIASPLLRTFSSERTINAKTVRNG
jgi:hypothetical protein